MQNVFMGWGAEGDTEAVQGSFIWAAGMGYPLIVAILGQPRLGWAMFAVQVLGVATAKVFVPPYLPSEWIRGETWSLPASISFGLLCVVTFHLSSVDKVSAAAWAPCY